MTRLFAGVPQGLEAFSRQMREQLGNLLLGDLLIGEIWAG